ncbi:hypothetical protein [Arthrobacter russicus]|uniref:Uncharacterized protein n=1 Tax=Arthrobacter russicus TaxID=172040 RepID=A0ABU1JET6_9MICC|nr:hypothetical protein [Arthrobacter russicus]MDR6269916.1 hypothetical protein [Arthrobacter russicus]
MNNLTSGISPLISIAFWALGVAVLIFVTLLVGSRLNRKRLLCRAQEQVPTETIADLQAALLDEIKDASANRRTPVDVTPFWSKSKISYPVRSAVIQPLIDARIIQAITPPAENWFTDFASTIWRDFFCLPPTVLVLSDRDWELMVASRMSGKGIVIERLTVKYRTQDTENNIASGGGNVSGVAQAGRDAKVKVGDVKQNNSVNDEAFVRTVVQALRFDADLTSEGSLAARLRTNADLLEQELEEPESEEARQSILDRISGLMTRYGDAMATTIRVLGGMTQN